MPTWRVKYTNISAKDFLKSDYYIKCTELLNNDNLISYLKEHEMKLVFYPHIEMQKFINLFQTKSDLIEIKSANTDIVEDLLIESKVLITDYSSVFFDFSYLEKKVIFFHFDNDENDNAVNKRWFSFEKDSIGPIFYDVNTMVRYIDEFGVDSIENCFKQKMQEFFPEKKCNNCENTFIEAINLLEHYNGK